jgi:regulatory protein
MAQKQSVEISEFDDAFLCLRKIDEEERVFKKSLELCARAEQYKAGIFSKLISRGFSVEAINAVLPRLEEEKILDDERYCLVWTRARMRQKAEGPAVILGKLAEKGISPALARKALKDIDFDAALAKAALREKARINSRKIPKAQGREKETLYSILRRQGFNSEKIVDVLDGLGKNIQDMT